MTDKPSQRQKTALVIGAGVGGTATAARLAHAGFKVTVLEKNDFTGGRCSLLHYQAEDGGAYRFDQGPSLLLLPRLFHQTFEELGTSLEDEGVELRKCEPNYRIWFGDGEQFELSSDLALMKKEVEKWEGKDGYERYLQYLQESGRHYELSVEHVLLKNFTSLKSMLRLSFLRHLLVLHPFESIWTRASKYFWTERLRRVFTFGSMYMGMSPFDAPGTYSLLQYTELAEGIWYPVGGFWSVVQAVVKVGERMGVEYRLNAAVERVLLSGDGSTALGVQLANGERLEADIVVNNSDLVYAYTTLLSSPAPTTPPSSSSRGKPQRQQPNLPTPYAESLSKRPASCSSISFYWALSRRVSELEAHNIFLADEYKESFDSIFKKHLIPDEPSFYVNVPSRVDQSAAPEGKDSVVVLVPVGHLTGSENDGAESGSTDSEGQSLPSQQENGGVTQRSQTQANSDIKSLSPSSQTGLKPTPQQDWPSMIALARKTILSTIAKRTGVDLGPLIVHEETNDPMTWRQKFNLDRGAILGLSHSFFNVLSFRPSTRARRGNPLLDGKFGGGILGRVAELLGDLGRKEGNIKGLYMVGASAHPGTGVPICLAGGRLVAEQVLEDLDMAVPWRGQEKGRRKVSELDRVEMPVWLDSWEQWLGIAVLLAVTFMLYISCI